MTITETDGVPNMRDIPNLPIMKDVSLPFEILSENILLLSTDKSLAQILLIVLKILSKCYPKPGN